MTAPFALAAAACILLSCAAPAQRPGDAPATIAIKNLATPGAFEIVNAGPDTQLAWAVGVEREQNGKWTAEVTDLTLVESCGQQPPSGGCLRLAHGKTLRPAPWNGLTCAAQCPTGCRANVHLGPGRFRFVVSACTGGARFFGPPFDLPAPPK